MIETVSVEDDVDAEVRAPDARVVLEELFGPLAQAAVGTRAARLEHGEPFTIGSQNYATSPQRVQEAAIRDA